MNIISFNKNSESLTEKYAPTNINEIIGARRQVYALVDWLKKYNMNAEANTPKTIKKVGKKSRKYLPKESKTTTTDKADKKKTKKKDPNLCSFVFVTGDNGTGKSTVVKAVLNDMNYLIKSVNFAKFGPIQSVDDYVEHLLTGDNIYEMIEYNKCKKVAILVDEIHSVSSPIKKSIINSLLKRNSQIWSCPVILVSSNKNKKNITGIKKECYHISMYAPETNNMLELFERVCLGENMKFENEDVVMSIINYSQNDYRRLMVTLGELLRIHGKSTIEKADMESYMKYNVGKDIEKSIYEDTINLFSRYDGISSALKIFENDKSNMPLMVHQNHFSATNEYMKNKSKSLKLSVDLTRNLAHGDVIGNYIYSDQNWTLQDTYGFYSCVYPSFKLNQNINTNKLDYDSKYPCYKPKFETVYPKNLNRYTNYKNAKLENDYFKKISTDNYQLVSKFIKSLLEDGKIEECEKLLGEYNLTVQDITHVLKIDY